MAIKALTFGNSAFYPSLKPFYDNEVQKGNIEIVGHAFFEDDSAKIRINAIGERGGVLNFKL